MRHYVSSPRKRNSHGERREQALRRAPNPMGHVVLSEDEPKASLWGRSHFGHRVQLIFRHQTLNGTESVSFCLDCLEHVYS